MILDHRGNSVSRSVETLAELAWLLGRDDLASAIDDADYPIYGAPKVKFFADGFGWRSPTPSAIRTCGKCSRDGRGPRVRPERLRSGLPRLTPPRDHFRRVSRRAAPLPGVASPGPAGHLAQPREPAGVAVGR
ncbi:hypothetical protein [Verrucosispora sp. WMMD573]|uniref:hypothetical protein n=1 Tax=Verrucosispora sp. WMMD573 TaxID=3015149 RepID=UPI00248C40C5|nr:hypothetical protein [Verrucosispora sp. WMMD573]WBB52414.1 hypothetical protein O7601_17650 [Verrucosispora sp. WMMD573]